MEYLQRAQESILYTLTAFYNDHLQHLEMPVNRNSITGLSLDAAGLVALADLSGISRRTALTGTASVPDIFFLAPGIHTQQSASKVNDGELPTTGAMTTGYVFRIENQATVHYLQNIGKPGSLVTVSVDPVAGRVPQELFTFPSLLYGTGIALTVACLVFFVIVHDFWALGVLLMLITARFLNMVVIKRRTQIGWKGAPEPDVHGDLLILLSQDRWVRMQGLVDDLKAVTAGQWLRDETTFEGFASASATLLVYVAAALASNASTLGSLCLAVLLLVSSALLGLCNSLTRDLHMFGRRTHVISGPKTYKRRLDMANELIRENGGRNDWAIAMGLVLPPSGASKVTL
ncbi:hypothetical protein BDZ89DRAFT_1055944 [Hymenopellis radicata]|nr:hypothetical protein BDZ89DRAFT_1055944 [Hymenopellis radicata]